jgi:hypothetical protein
MGTAKARTQRFRVTVTPTEGWLHPLDRALYEAPGVGREAFHGVRQLADETVITLAEVTGPVDRIEAACSDTEHVVSYTVSPLETGWLLFAWIEPTPVVERMLRIRRETGMLAAPPFEWTDGGSLRLDVVGRADRIRGAAERLQDDVDVSIDRTVTVGTDGLSAVHRTTVEAAVEAGYYDVPRTATLGDVAASVDASRDRTERRLREAERELFTRAAERAST